MNKEKERRKIPAIEGGWGGRWGQVIRGDMIEDGNFGVGQCVEVKDT